MTAVGHQAGPLGSKEGLGLPDNSEYRLLHLPSFDRELCCCIVALRAHKATPAVARSIVIAPTGEELGVARLEPAVMHGGTRLQNMCGGGGQR